MACTTASAGQPEFLLRQQAQDSQNGFYGSKRRTTRMAITAACTGQRKGFYAASAGQPEWFLRQQAQDNQNVFYDSKRRTTEWLLGQQGHK